MGYSTAQISRLEQNQRLPNPTLVGKSALSIAGGGEVIAGHSISVTGGSVVPATTSPASSVETTAPTTLDSAPLSFNPDGLAPTPVITGGAISNGHVTLNGTSDAPGADDDGSGVAAVMELARVFATRPT